MDLLDLLNSPLVGVIVAGIIGYILTDRYQKRKDIRLVKENLLKETVDLSNSYSKVVFQIRKWNKYKQDPKKRHQLEAIKEKIEESEFDLLHVSLNIQGNLNIKLKLKLKNNTIISKVISDLIENLDLILEKIKNDEIVNEELESGFLDSIIKIADIARILYGAKIN